MVRAVRVLEGREGEGGAIARSGCLDDLESGNGAPARLRLRSWGAPAVVRGRGGVSAQVWTPAGGVAAGDGGLEIVEEVGAREGPWNEGVRRHKWGETFGTCGNEGDVRWPRGIGVGGDMRVAR